MTALEHGGPDRADVYARLTRRNRVVSMLRIAVPVVGLAAGAAVGVGIAIDAVLNQFGLARIHIDRNNLVVDTPELSSTMADGTVISLASASARLAPNNSDKVGLTDARFTATLPTGQSFTALAPAANLTVSTQTVFVPGRTDLSTNEGATGTADRLTVDALGLTAKAENGVDLTFANGNRLEAADMVYDHQAQQWTFHKVRVWLVSTPGEAQ